MHKPFSKYHLRFFNCIFCRQKRVWNWCLHKFLCLFPVYANLYRMKGNSFEITPTKIFALLNWSSNCFIKHTCTTVHSLPGSLTLNILHTAGSQMLTVDLPKKYTCLILHLVESSFADSIGRITLPVEKVGNISSSKKLKILEWNKRIFFKRQSFILSVPLL